MFVDINNTLQQFLKHKTTAYPVAVCSNGSLKSTSKSALLSLIEGYGLYQTNGSCDVYVIDGPALLQTVKPKGNINTFDEYLYEVVVPYIFNKASRYKRIDIVLNVYRKPSIKAVMRERQESGCHVDVTPQTCLSINWSECFRNDDKKKLRYNIWF